LEGAELLATMEQAWEAGMAILEQTLAPQPALA
jgi:hypothetical protein